ncbi:MAG: nucleotidyltransferase domain-containing protein [Ignavibacteria bacterium]|jgi:predicted nucleotidyltransferase
MEKYLKTDRESVLVTQILDVLKRYLDPNRIILFGSRAKGNFNSRSDFDIAIDIKRPDVVLQRRISEEIEKFSGLYNVDIVYLPGLEQGFINIISKTGIVLHER